MVILRPPFHPTAYLSSLPSAWFDCEIAHFNRDVGERAGYIQLMLILTASFINNTCGKRSVQHNWLRCQIQLVRLNHFEYSLFLDMTSAHLSLRQGPAAILRGPDKLISNMSHGTGPVLPSSGSQANHSWNLPWVFPVMWPVNGIVCGLQLCFCNLWPCGCFDRHHQMLTAPIKLR